MSEKKSPADLDETPCFITKDLRPNVSIEEECPVISSDTPAPEIKRRAGELLGPLLRSMLGVETMAATPLTADYRCLRNDNVIFTEVEGESVLLDLASGHYYSLNRTGSVIWEMLTGEKDLGAVHRTICQRFEVDAETAWEDIIALVHNLCSEKLARLEAPNNASL